MTFMNKLRLSHRLGSAVGVFIAIVLLQVAVAAMTIEVLSSVRAYVTGESLYSKGQKDAQLHIDAYLRLHDEAHYQGFLDALAIPEGDARARRALQLPDPDRPAARQGLLAGENHPGDIDGMIRLFVWGHRLPFMARAIRTWSTADEVIAGLRALAHHAHESIVAGRDDAPEVRALMAQAPVLNARLTRLERDFSDELGEASRIVQALLLGLNALIGLTLSILGGRYIHRSIEVQRQKDAAMAELERAAQERERQQLAHRNLELERMAYTDSLTGLPNREALEHALEGALAGARRDAVPFALLFLDLDGFKAINDTFGHLAGDLLLKETARRLRQSLRRQDEVFRVSGDEFIAILTEDPASAAVKVATDRVLATLRQPFDLGHAAAHVTASIGVARYPENGSDARALLLAADAAMYLAKQSGKDMACA
jgi:diguanylate cyclase (GGDEF)-like protein